MSDSCSLGRIRRRGLEGSDQFEMVSDRVEEGVPLWGSEREGAQAFKWIFAKNVLKVCSLSGQTRCRLGCFFFSLV